MVRLFLNSEYIDIVLVYGDACGSAPRARRVSVQLLHFKRTRGKCCHRGMLERVEDFEYFL
jgi:hypothetical protein